MLPDALRTEGYAGVLFALLGTLIPAASTEGRRPHLHAMARCLGAGPTAFETAWLRCAEDRFLRRLGTLDQTIRELARRLGAPGSAEGLRKAAAVRLEFTRSLLEACGPVLPALTALRAEGLRLAVVSDTPQETPRLWAEGPLGCLVDATVISCEEGICKPDPRIYRTALARLSLGASRCAYVGDGESLELTGAQLAGPSPFLFRFPAPAVEDLRHRPDTTFDGPVLRDLEELRGILRPP